MASNASEVLVCSEQRKSMLTTGRRDQEVSRTGIDSLRPADSAQTSGSDVGLPVRFKERERIEKAQQPVELFRRAESVEQFLEDRAGQKEPVA